MNVGTNIGSDDSTQRSGSRTHSVVSATANARMNRRHGGRRTNQEITACPVEAILNDPVKVQEVRQLVGGAELFNEGDDDWMRRARGSAVINAIKHRTMTSPEEIARNAWGLFCAEFPMRPGGIPLWSVHVCDGKASQALALSQLNYWMPRARKKIGGLKFVVKSRSELSLETGLSEKAIQTALKALTEEKCFLEKRMTSWKGRSTSAFRVEYSNIRNSFLQLDVMKQDACRAPAS